MAVLDHGHASSTEVASLWTGPRRIQFRYDRERDTLSAALSPRQPAVSHDLDGELWVRLIPATGAIVGFEIEDFTTAFLSDRPQLARLWQRTRASIAPRWIMEPRRQQFTDALLIHVRGRLAAMGGPRAMA